ncbi:glycoside hydrolase [Novosphingobium umbonatum]|uniref:Glycoside hydrolase n=1 Tax=Novosphingobium umbonatum TaxID=1908524 RepID=A0A3S2V5I1_9SPHN|nr:glycosyl hydrolase [Novosphingobium umbonatum]RVU04080.1 glycoside hydrolase [Novosphingobium umbonatum]
MAPIRFTRRHKLALSLASALALSGSAFAQQADLETQFRDPPQSARPRVWWHWMNGNITKDGIAKDMAWMKSVGIGGLQNFDVNLQTPQVVEKRLAYMTPEWKDAFRFAAQEAERQGLELAIAASPGWSETGGPWVKPADGLKKLVWSETLVPAGKAFKGKIATPPQITGPYQAMGKGLGFDDIAAGHHPEAAPNYYSDVAVLAVPVAVQATPAPKASVGGQAVDAALLFDSNLTAGVSVPRGTAQAAGNVTYAYDAPQTMRSATVFVPGAKIMFRGPTVDPVLEASDDGQNWREITHFTVADVPTTVSFAPVTAKFFRLVLKPLVSTSANMGAPAEGVEIPGLFATLAGGDQPWTLGQFGLYAEAKVNLAETKAGFALAHDYYTLTNPADAATGATAAQVVDLTKLVQADGSLDWKAPALPKGQQWRIVRLGASLLGTTNHPAPAEATGLEVDKFDADAVGRYMDHYLGMYRDAAGADMIGAKGVRAILTDSIEVGAANYTPKMLAQFKALRGYDATPWLPALTGMLVGSREDSDKFLYDWRRTLADLMASEHYGTVAAKAHAAGLKVYGEALEDHRPSLGDDMSMRTHADVPMAALWTFTQKDGPNPSYLADMKGAASVAHIYGQNLVAAESMTSALTYWADSPRTLKHVIDLEFVTGVNRPVVHTSVHQPSDDKVPGLSLMIFGQYFNRHEAWAPLAKGWVDYISRNSLLLQNGRNVADVGYFYGEEAPITGLYGDKKVGDAPKTRAFDFVNFDALTGALRNEGKELVSAGGARYGALYLGGSSYKMTLPALRKIAALAQGGATIIGMAPQGSPSLGQEDKAEYAALVAKLWPAGGDTVVGKGRVIASQNVEEALDKAGIAPDFRMSGGAADAEVPFLHRRWESGDSYFLVNRKERVESFTAHFRVTGKQPELWHAETGTFEPVSYRIENGETIVPLTLLAEESVHVVFRKPATGDALAIKKLAPAPLSTLDGAWTVAFQSGRGAPASVVLPQLAPLNENADSGIAHFSGVATYAKDFAAPKGWKAGQPLWLNLGQLREVAQVSVNGKDLGIVWHAPYRVDLGSAVKAGKNHVEIRVANLWINRLIGDAQKGAQKVTFTAMPTYRPDAPLRESGLIGPVVLEGAAR